jgi:protein-S-isoprenylcysteine O-methyltransferase Ste14
LSTERTIHDHAAVRVFPPAVPLLTIVGGVLIDRRWPLSIGITVNPVIRYVVGAGIIVAAVVGLGAWSVILMRRSGQSENPWKPTTSIIDYGPFRITRNPMYLQMVIVCLGFSLLLANVWIAILTPLCAVVLDRLVIRYEEQYLQLKFGEHYLKYKARVRRWI